MWHVVRNTDFCHWVVGAFTYLRDKGFYHIVFSIFCKVVIGYCFNFFLKFQGELIGFLNSCTFWIFYIGNDLVRFVVWEEIYFRTRYSKQYNRSYKKSNSSDYKKVISHHRNVEL